jgi:hypothetical protein
LYNSKAALAISAATSIQLLASDGSTFGSKMRYPISSTWWLVRAHAIARHQTNADDFQHSRIGGHIVIKTQRENLSRSFRVDCAISQDFAYLLETEEISEIDLKRV